MTRTRGFTLIELLIVVAIIAILAAISVPALLRARAAANESGAIGDLRAVSSGEASYASSNGGAFGSLSCLNNPTGCGFRPGAIPFIDSQLASLQDKQGYVRSFALGATGGGSPDPGVSAFVYAATPVSRGSSGIRGFGVDQTGRVCQTTDGTIPPVSNATIVPATCEPLK